MGGPPVRDVDAERGDLALAHPDADVLRAYLTTGLDPEIRQHSNQDFLEIADVATDVLAIRLQIDDRVTDQLTRAVERDLPAPVRLLHGDAARCQPLGVGDDVRRLGVASEGEHRRVLE